MIRKLFMALTVVALAAPAVALDYWPDDPDGHVYRYRSQSSGLEYDAAFNVVGDMHHMNWTHGICTGGESYLVDDSSVSVTSWGSSCQGGYEPNYNWFDPPFEIAHDGMVDGEWWGYIGIDRGGGLFVGVSVTDETVTVPMGTFETKHVQLTYGWCYYSQVFDYWLDRDLGPVRIDDSELVSITGPVATTERTLSGVKSLFR